MGASRCKPASTYEPPESQEDEQRQWTFASLEAIIPVTGFADTLIYLAMVGGVNH